MGTDSDGDGISNACDLDDDNDGILDANEGVADNDNILEWGYNGTGTAPSIFNSSVISTAQNVTNGSGLSAIIPNGMTSFYISGVGATTISQSISNNSYFQFKFTTVNFPNTMQYLYDRFSLYLRPPSEFPTYKMRLYISTDNFVTSTDISGEIAYPIVPYEDRVVFPLASPYNLAPNKSYTVRLYFYSVSGGSSATFNHDDFRVLTMQYKDTDGDGIPDYLDLDSDNDGCLDALEGSQYGSIAEKSLHRLIY
ncbi:thrombospondin type 3 repeat-containing protein [Chryseobacterium sp. NKUCC03_KSP]|uniref:thrombospondin type 3 repeat-containing protein n=1 Tax=Chryseobacterium sp. NKUCC03_KSP TaxID=2842125 RepID=UPI001C5B128E|nr:thrombospondin type 3 repeat-containing protein [Chryseobacterium sp. NKUCC03_KSP]MBW3524847.1 thrombospondin type 3 repeat-containing protein [Chryseobacterium sp. NKUCC03_KSP]